MGIVKRKSPISGRVFSIEIEETQEWIDKWEELLRCPEDFTLIQDHFPNLSLNEREFIKIGITPSEWNEMFGTQEEENDEKL